MIKLDFQDQDFGLPADEPNKNKNSKYKRIGYEDWPDEEPAEIVSNEDELVYVEEIDDFPDYKFSVVWQQKCWDVLYRMYYDVESSAFLQEISPEAMGDEFYQDYISTIKFPINFLMIKQKMIQQMYLQASDYTDDMNLVFNNCMSYNERDSGFYKSA